MASKISKKEEMRRLLLKFFLGACLGILGITFLLFIVVSLFAVSYWRAFATEAHISFADFQQIVQQGVTIEPQHTDDRVNILLLGTDAVENREGDPVLTDTIMLLSLDLESGEVYAVNFPRDIWLPEHVSKINALYYYGREKFPHRPEQFTEEVLEDITQMPIHYTVVVSLDSVAAVIDAVGGVEITVPESFTDTQFPRSDVDIRTERDPAKLYQTVSFTEGKELMNGERALQYIRSRKSNVIDQAGDDARAKRQQQVIAALLQQVAQPSLVRHPAQLGKLYKMYSDLFARYVPVADMIALGREFIDADARQLTLEPRSLTIDEAGNKGVLTHPPVDRRRGWIYLIKNQDEFVQEVQEQLHL